MLALLEPRKILSYFRVPLCSEMPKMSTSLVVRVGEPRRQFEQAEVALRETAEEARGGRARVVVEPEAARR